MGLLSDVLLFPDNSFLKACRTKQLKGSAAPAHSVLTEGIL